MPYLPCRLRPILTALLAAVLLGAASRPAPLIVYSAPAGLRPAGADRIHPTVAVLPDGRVAAPAGSSLFVGTNPLGVALSPDGRYAIVSNDGAGSGATTGSGTSLPSAIRSPWLTRKPCGSSASIAIRRPHFSWVLRQLRDPADPSRRSCSLQTARQAACGFSISTLADN